MARKPPDDSGPEEPEYVRELRVWVDWGLRNPGKAVAIAAFALFVTYFLSDFIQAVGTHVHEMYVCKFYPMYCPMD